MNEPAFYESAQRLGQRIEREGGSSDEARLRWAFRHVTARQPSQEELDLLGRMLANARENSRDKQDKIDFRLLASLLLNLDETVTKE